MGARVEHFTRLMFTRIITGLAGSLAEDDFSVAQIAALHLLDQQGTLRVTALAEAIGRSTSTTSRLAEGLVQRGLVDRHEDPQDRRARILALTPEGRRFVDRVSEERLKVVMATVAAMPASAKQEIWAALEAALDGA